MKYINSVERYYIDQGEQRGEQRGLADMACRQARKRYFLLLEQEEAAVRALPVETLRDLTDALLDFQGREDFLAWLESHQPIG